MQVVRDLGGYSLGRSDSVRRAMSKKKMDVMEKERQYFIHGKLDENDNIEIAGCVRNGVPEDVANQIFDDMIDFAKYAFNKSHAAAYGVLSYETAYLKCYYPVEFMAALMTSIMGNNDKVVEYMRECSSMGIGVLPPDINKSFSKFSVDGDHIRFGLAAVKNVGANAIDNIVAEREANGPYKNLTDLVKRIDSKFANKKTIESLIKCGAFDSTGDNRASLMFAFEDVLDSISRDKKRNVEGQMSMFDMFADMGKQGELELGKIEGVEEFKDRIRLDMEKEVLGLYVSGHPLSEYSEKLEQRISITNACINKLKEAPEKLLEINEQDHIIGGMIISKKLFSTKNNEMMAFINIEDLYGSMEVVVFPRVLEKYKDLIKEDQIVLIKGKISIRGDEDVSLIAGQVKSIDDDSEFTSQKPFYNGGYSQSENYNKQVLNGTGKKVFIRLDSMSNQDLLNKIYSTIRAHQGRDPVIIFPLDENEHGEKKTYQLKDMGVYASDELKAYLADLVGEGDIVIK